MKRTIAMLLGACALAGSAWAQEPHMEPARVPPGVHLAPVLAAAGTTRDDVRHEYEFARVAGMLSPDGEGGDTHEVLAARERYNAALAQALEADPGREAALAAATEAAVEMSGADAIADAEVYEMTADDGELVGYLFVVESEAD
ncbi:hypothetical protein [Rubrivivax gelatinosus]|uniref:Uncharacterized protein n=1 Tax=Rubrivivax gelatinosus TaxID=28068 RepID=A0ABS1DVI6_RUBGE|nr:hypothetical protein [Rubrivivax gelatinosus]MBK1713131.1 hypothetical protein [Rubrivivax gelatinosus]